MKLIEKKKWNNEMDNLKKTVKFWRNILKDLFRAWNEIPKRFFNSAILAKFYGVRSAK